MICKSCLKDLNKNLFHNNKSRKSGKDHYCKSCRSEYVKLWSKTAVGPACRKKARRNFYLENKDYELSKSRQWRYGKRKGTPSWLTKDHLRQIADVYALARDCRLTSGEAYEVDHIVPINGTNVCGLHVPWNLQVLPSDINSRKSNHLVQPSTR